LAISLFFRLAGIFLRFLSYDQWQAETLAGGFR
jgi:hypothetical protein